MNRPTGTPSRTDLAHWLWGRLEAEGEGNPVKLGRLIAMAKEVGLLPRPTPGLPKPKLTLLFDARRHLATLHPGWHVAQHETPRPGERPFKFWSLAQGPDPDPESEPDYEAIRRTVDLKRFVDADIGPPLRGGRWACPLHGGEGPNFSVHGDRCRCFTCGWSGDVIDYLAAREKITRAAAAARLDPLSSGRSDRPTTPVKPSTPKPPPKPTGLTEADALALVQTAEAALWSPAGSNALAYLMDERHLTAETIRANHLGWVDRVEVPKASGEGTFSASGITIPWFTDGRLCLVKIRQLSGAKPKYAEACRDPSRMVCFPSPEVIHPGRAVAIEEGELDALVVGQAVGNAAAAVTIGGAQSVPNEAFLSRLRPAGRLFIATDADGAGEKAAAHWPKRAKRVRPPVGKDWGETADHGINLSRWWADVLRGVDGPELFTWGELSLLRWGLNDRQSNEVGPPCPEVAALLPEQRERWEERAAIIEFDGGLSRADADAEAAALAEFQRHVLTAAGAEIPDPAPGHGIVIDGGWRTRIADLPHDQWVLWRNRSTEILGGLGHAPTVEEIRLADHLAPARYDFPCSFRQK